MNNQRNHHTRRPFCLILALIGLLGWSTRPILSSSQAARAATAATITKLTYQSASRAVTNGKIAFASHRDGNDEIDTMNPDGSDRKRLTSEPGIGEPAWSPDGTKVAFVKHSGDRGEIFVMNADGSNQTKLTTSRNDNFPAWSPDGKKIAFSQNRYFGTGLYVMNADGSDQRIIPGDFYQPAWSPDGPSWQSRTALISI